MHRYQYYCAILVVLFSCASTPLYAQTKDGLALVIGNLSGSETTPTRPDNVQPITRRLQSLGYHVISGSALGPQQQHNLLQQFWRRAPQYRKSVVFFDGRSHRKGSEYFLLPVTPFVQLLDEDLPIGTINIRQFLNRLETENHTSMVFIDTCELGAPRNSTEPGFSCIDALHARENTLLSISRTTPTRRITKPDSRVTLYADAILATILKHHRNTAAAMEELRHKLEQATRGRQRPTLNNRLVGTFNFRRTAPPPRARIARPRRSDRFTEHTRNELGIRRKRRQGQFLAARLRSTELRRELQLRRYSINRIQRKLRSLDLRGRTGALIYDRCKPSTQKQKACATLYKARSFHDYELKVQHKTLNYVAELTRSGLKISAKGMDVTRSMRGYLRKKYKSSTNNRRAIKKARRDIKKSISCDARELACIAKLLFPAEMQAAMSGLNQLIVLPIGSIGVVPLAALPFGKDKQLVDKIAVTIAPDLSTLVSGTGRRLAQTPGSSLVIGDPDLSGRPHRMRSRLEGANQEARYVAKQLQGDLLLGKSASLKAIKARLTNVSNDLSVVYFATHGTSNAVDPMDKSALLLKGGDLTGTEIKKLKLKGKPLVIMSACQTGLGKTFGGGGVFGLAQAWLHAGAGAVLMSLWDVDDSATKTLMQSFVSGYKSGLSAEVALARAMRKFKSRQNEQTQTAGNDRGFVPVSNRNIPAPKVSLWSSFVLYGPATPALRRRPFVLRRQRPVP